MGNHDYYIVSGEPCPRSTSANVCLEHQRLTIGAKEFDWLQKSPPQLEFVHTDGQLISCVHGGWRDPRDEYLYQLSADYFRERPGKYFFSGHTHVQITAQLENKVYCNPGSVGQPRDGDARAAFATLADDGTIALHRIVYDVEAMCQGMAEQGFDRGLYENLKYGTRIGGVVDKILISR